MAIHTQESLSGFHRIGAVAQLHRTRRRTPVPEDRHRALPQGTRQHLHEVETTFHDLVAYRGAAEQGAERLAKDDNIIADGRVRDYSYERNGQRYEGEEFIASRIGHDPTRTRYEVDRSGRPASGRDSAAFAAPQQATPSNATAIGM